MNGYFQVVNEDEQTSIMLYPAQDGGEDLDITEAADYLTFREINYNLNMLYAAAKECKEKPVKVLLHPGKGRAEQEMLKVWISEDHMSASVRFYAPSNDGKVMEKPEILDDLKYRGVVFGVCQDVLDDFLEKREYCRDYTIALGLEKKRGEDARIEFFFNTDTRIRPTLQADGSVDFFHLNTINNCTKGDLLARLIPAVPSVPGMTVKGEQIPGGEPKNKHLRFGKNVELSEDGSELRALVSGHIKLEGERVSVSDVLELNDVDTSMGNVEYAGSIQIAGSVCENFCVRAGGNVIVNGVVEGAQIEAGGDIIIARGMNGMGKGKIMAGGNIIAKFFENAEVSAGGYVDSDSILYSTVCARDAIHVGGKRGFITGGRITATNGVEVKNLGSSMGADTIVEVGADPSLKKRALDLQNEIQENTKVLNQAYPILMNASNKVSEGASLPEEQYEYIKNLYALYKMKKQENRKAYERLDEVQALLERSKAAAVKVSGEVYMGTRIIIGDVSMVVKGNMRYCKFVRERGDVRMKSL